MCELLGKWEIVVGNFLIFDFRILDFGKSVFGICFGMADCVVECAVGCVVGYVVGYGATAQ